MQFMKQGSSVLFTKKNDKKYGFPKARLVQKNCVRANKFRKIWIRLLASEGVMYLSW